MKKLTSILIMIFKYSDDECGTGYKQDGSKCIDIDECAIGTHNCASNSFCTNHDGLYTCSCKDQYEGDDAALNYIYKKGYITSS